VANSVHTANTNRRDETVLSCPCQRWEVDTRVTTNRGRCVSDVAERSNVIVNLQIWRIDPSSAVRPHPYVNRHRLGVANVLSRLVCYTASCSGYLTNSKTQLMSLDSNVVLNRFFLVTHLTEDCITLLNTVFFVISLLLCLILLLLQVT